jgi:hypothetical protein
MIMRTTLSIDADVLEAARALAEARGVSIGAVISDLARRALTPDTERRSRNGFPLLPVRPGAGLATPELVRRLLEETE